MATRSLIPSRSHLKDQRGGETVEFAIVSLLLFTVLFAIIEFGLLMYNQQVITNAGREAARFGIVARPAGYKVTKVSIEQIARSYAENFIVSFKPKEFTVNSNQCGEFRDLLKVDVSYKYSFLFLPHSLEMGTTAAMICE